MRKHELLNDSERKQLLNIPENRDDLVRLYTFEPVEIDLIRQRREDHNRLGVALQLALLRYPGMTMAQMLDSGALPDDLIIFIAEQIGIPVQALSDYGLRGQTMTDHARELALALGMRPAARSDIPMMIEAAASSAWATDKGMPIARGIVEALRQAKIVLPAPATIERAGIAGRARARKLATQTLMSGLKPAQVEMLDKLSIADPVTGISPLAWLKAIPVASRPDNVREIIDRLMFVRKIGIPAQTGSTLHPDRYLQFVREGRMSPAYMIERYAPSRRRATVVAFLIDTEERLTDAAIEMADKLIGSMFTRAKNSQARRYVATSKDVSRLMRLFRGTINALATGVGDAASSLFPMPGIMNTIVGAFQSTSVGVAKAEQIGVSKVSNVGQTSIEHVGKAKKTTVGTEYRETTGTYRSIESGKDIDIHAARIVQIKRKYFFPLREG